MFDSDMIKPFLCYNMTFRGSCPKIDPFISPFPPRQALLAFPEPRNVKNIDCLDVVQPWIP